MKVTMTNAVVRVKLNSSIDLRTIAQKGTFIEYNPHKFSGMIWHHRRLGGTCLVFSTGQLICHGAKSWQDARKVARRYARKIQLLLEKPDLSVQSITRLSGTLLVDLGGALDLQQLPKLMNAQYEPELFNAATFKRDGIHFSCFSSGKVIVAGVKSTSSVFPTLMELSLLIASS